MSYSTALENLNKERSLQGLPLIVDEGLEQTGFMLLLTQMELHDLQMMLNRHVAVERSESVASLRGKVNKLMEAV